MSNDTFSFLVMGLCCLGFLALAIFLLVFTFTSAAKGFRGFATTVRAKKRSWDEFISRTGLRWESKTPTSNPVMDAIVGSDFADKTGRVIGTYRGYPVTLSNLTRHQYGGPAGTMFVTGQTYYTEFRLTIQNPAATRLTIRKEKQLTFEPPDLGKRLVSTALSFGRLAKIPDTFAINIQQQQLVYVQAGLEQDSNKLYNILETLCDLADAVGAYQARDAN